MQSTRSSFRLPVHGTIARSGWCPAKSGYRHGWMALMLLATVGAPCLAATFTVNSSADIASPAAGVVTLRSAIAAADTAGGANVINVPAALGPYNLTHGALTTSNTANNILSIQGAGGSAVIDGGGLSGVFYLTGGTVSLSSLTIQHGNVVITYSGAFGGCTGGGVFIGTSTTVNITASTVTDNQTTNGSGGGICAYGGTLNLVNSTLSNNDGSFDGGGIRVLQDATVHITNSTVSGNRAMASGGGNGGGILNQGTLTVTGSTISGNTAHYGGAIAPGNEGTIFLSNVTIAGNSSNPESAQIEARELVPHVTMVSTIIADPVAGTNCLFDSGITFTSNGHNLDSGNSCGFTSGGDLINADPVLGPLQNNGGPTATMALLAGSKAIDTGANPQALATDQRGAGFARVVGSAADIGAFEAQPPVIEGQAVEYIDTVDFPASPGGHFFYTADPAEQAFVDGGGAGHFTRTGKSFATGGYARVCRFYGSIQPGPNSHFLTVIEAECNALKALQVTPTPTTVQQWNYEGLGFDISAPVQLTGGALGCPGGTQAVYRGYNNAFTAAGKNPWDSNHRYSTSHADIAALVSGNGWNDEGIAFCSPQ
jgi:Repeat of unknown function (DUF5648)